MYITGTVLRNLDTACGKEGKLKAMIIKEMRKDISLTSQRKGEMIVQEVQQESAAW